MLVLKISGVLVIDVEFAHLLPNFKLLDDFVRLASPLRKPQIVQKNKTFNNYFTDDTLSDIPTSIRNQIFLIPGIDDVDFNEYSRTLDRRIEFLKPHRNTILKYLQIEESIMYFLNSSFHDPLSKLVHCTTISKFSFVSTEILLNCFSEESNKLIPAPDVEQVPPTKVTKAHPPPSAHRERVQGRFFCFV